MDLAGEPHKVVIPGFLGQGLASRSPSLHR
jgi:hypothetical protein